MRDVDCAIPGTLWLLLDIPGAPGLVAALQERYASYESHLLFDGTPFHGVRDWGPRLVKLTADCPLAKLSQTRPRQWAGLFLLSRAPVAILLAHLRQMLVVRFDADRQGVLSYYNPQTASYFFDGADARELSRWLGPIILLYWHGGTWADKAVGSLGWQQLINPRLPGPTLGPREFLGARQQQRLQTCLLERHAYQWSCASGHDYGKTWHHLQEGVAQGFRDSGALDDWLGLRAQYPAASFPPGLEGDTPGERLENLRRAWSRTHG
ncbi:DUF4123 domain-containing protein [Pseudomonas gingeri]|uniref:DUF4123 domain-containing protein n=1 Tax=Pseudomonas gingeri TaxID=117681 RepID=A0A7Y7Y515_9PSED|nr:DUF4123 domain-containing protein [Pseudomonas gingeri]NVZ24922.1 DUF4123 domain-containing protein [Pseudomonas gingeri]NWC17970.1 DUF4123 domain-containing protein [Pseudomonas gingeri]NWE45571.1 DUF4123 domain-containing protein [Pseudomonas gingeri]NWE67509.1 DUF4123 domain-containing protein [Pseudomonas gingeri]